MAFERIMSFFKKGTCSSNLSGIGTEPSLVEDDCSDFDDLFEDICFKEAILTPENTPINVYRTLVCQAKVLDSVERGISHDDSDRTADSNPDRLEVIIEPIDCGFEEFCDALFETEEGYNFCHTSDNTIIDVGGSCLNLEPGSKLLIYSDNTISN